MPNEIALKMDDAPMHLPPSPKQLYLMVLGGWQ